MDNLNFILPEIFISLSLMFVLMFGVFKKNSTSIVYNLSIISLLIGLFLVMSNPINSNISIFNNSYKIDYLSSLMKMLSVTSAIFIMFISSKFLKKNNIYKDEYPVLILSCSLGIMVMISANDLIVF